MPERPSLVSQKATQVDELALWNYSFTFMTDEADVTFEVVWNENAATKVDRSPAVAIDGYVHTVVFERLGLREAHCARAVVQGVTFPAPVAPSIQLIEPVTIRDLASFLGELLGPSSTWPIEIRCFYVAMLDGMPMKMPVVLVPKHDLSIDDASLFEQIDSTVRQWFDSAQPPKNDARLSFEITVWSAIEGIDEPLLRIADASLPLNSVA